MIGLFFIGMFLTVIGLFIAYYLGSKEKKETKEWI